MRYQQLYAYLVGQVDDSLQMIGEALLRENCGRADLLAVGEKLKAALQEAEERYLQAEGEIQ